MGGVNYSTLSLSSQPMHSDVKMVDYSQEVRYFNQR